MTLTLSIDRGDDAPVYQQVADQIRGHIADGALVPGAALPTVRRLAGDLGVNLNTIARAYRLLEDEGFLTIKDRSGVTVAPPARGVEDEARDRLLDELGSLLARLRQAGLGRDETTREMLRKFLVGDGIEGEP
jgi:GntR family transcriptional regulator